MPNSDQIHLQAYTETSESNLFNFVQKFRFPLWYAVCFLFLFEMVQNLFFCFVFTSICVRVCAFFHNSNGSSSGNNSSSACRHCCVIRTRAYPPCSFTCDSTMHSVVIAFSISNWNLSWHYLNSNLMKESNGKLNRSLSHSTIVPLDLKHFGKLRKYYGVQIECINNELHSKWKRNKNSVFVMEWNGVLWSNKHLTRKFKHSCAFRCSKYSIDEVKVVQWF